jgi:hypothetical protein
MEREASEAGLDREARLAKVAYRTAEDILDRVKDSCKPSDEWPRWMVEHSPDKFDEFVNRYLNGEEAEELKRFIENNSDVYKSPEEFWNEVKILYEALWDEEMSQKLGELLSDELEGGFINIVENAEVSDSTKVKRLKAYKEVLEQFANAINRALNEKKPLTELELLDWFDKMGDAVFGLKNYNYYEMIGYYVGFYDGLNDDGKLNVLGILLDEIDSVLYDVDTELSELEALTNQS